MFEKMKVELAPESREFRILCPMQWTVRAASLQSIMDNYGVLQELWDEALDVAKVHTRIIGVQTTMTRFEYLFGTVRRMHSKPCRQSK